MKNKTTLNNINNIKIQDNASINNSFINQKNVHYISYDLYVKNIHLMTEIMSEGFAVVKDNTILFYVNSAQEQKDPSQYKEIRKDLFNDLLTEFYKLKEKEWSKRHAIEKNRRFYKDIKSVFKDLTIQEITVKFLLNYLKGYQDRGLIDLAHRILTDISMVFDYAIVLEKVDYNFCSKVKKFLKTHSPTGFISIKESEISELLRSISFYKNERSDIIRYALKFISLTFVRSKELINAEWSEIDWAKRTWTIPKEKMKMDREHIVPLATQALDLLSEIKEYTKNDVYIFPHYFHNRPLKSNRLIYALYDMGYKGRMTVHGFRSMASTILNEQNFNVDAIELQLAHLEANKVRRSYNRSEYFEERIKIMQWWADYLLDKFPEYISGKQLSLDM